MCDASLNNLALYHMHASEFRFNLIFMQSKKPHCTFLLIRISLNKKFVFSSSAWSVANSLFVLSCNWFAFIITSAR